MALTDCMTNLQFARGMAATEFLFILTVLHLIVSNVVFSERTDGFDEHLFEVPVPVRPPSITSIRIIDRLRSKVINSVGPERRMFFPFNRLILSMIAPRLMRFQFDMMLTSIISEVVRKFVVPIMGSITGQNNEDEERPNLLGQLFSPHTTSNPSVNPSANPSANPSLDIKQMLIKAQNAVHAQGLNVQNSVRTANGLPPLAPILSTPSPLPQLNSEQMTILAEALTQTLPHNNLGNYANNDISQSNPNPITPQKYIQIPNTSGAQIIIARPMQVDQVANPDSDTIPNNPSSTNTKELQITPKTVKTVMKPKSRKIKTKPIIVEENEAQEDPDTDLPHFQMNYYQTNVSDNTNDKQSQQNQETEEFQVTYVDNNLDNYGNQVSAEPSNHFRFGEDLVPQTDQQMYETLNNHKTIYKLNEVQERASRWNNVLVNMDAYKTKRMDSYRTKKRSIDNSQLYRLV